MLFSAKGYSNDSIQYIKSEADSAYIQNQYERAVELYLQLANECKNDAQLYYNLGCAYYRMDSIAKSVLWLERAAKIAPDDSDIIYNLEHIRNLDIPPSLALEKWITTSLITLNDAIEIKPNYTSDDENNILFTAPAGTPDIECYYEEFNSICEVTMLTGRDQ